MDHFVLTIEDINKSKWFYGEVLGMEIITFNNDRVAAKFGDQKINFHETGCEIKPHAYSPVRGSSDFCLVSDDTVENLRTHLKDNGIVVELGPVKRTGSLGPIFSIYIRDPDKNLIEISTYNH
ncbi:VOC family protein [Geomicrobium sp. JCM 19037]|uniref:VOC family protein n=1 Tax=Geomicrobium sp. JCM 19037 TaxID=1460634 RepID=UPI0027D8D5E3|nr:VOC family protein [Geomicrobium sp. JCM 19037]